MIVVPSLNRKIRNANDLFQFLTISYSDGQKSYTIIIYGSVGGAGDNPLKPQERMPFYIGEPSVT